MYRHIYLLLSLIAQLGWAQVAVNTDGAPPDSSAIFDIQSTTGGILIPRMTTAQRELINIPATGLLVYDLDFNSFWLYNGTEWQNLAPGDDLGDHVATQNIALDHHWLSGDGDDEGIYVDSVGNIGAGVSTPHTMLEISDAAPELRITDNRSNSSGEGVLLGTLGWWSRDHSFGTHYESLASIEIINTNNSATPDPKMNFNVWEHAPGEYTKRTPLSLLYNGDATFAADINAQGEIKYGPNAMRPVGAQKRMAMACAEIIYDASIATTHSATGIASVTSLSTGQYDIVFDPGLFDKYPIVTVTPLSFGDITAGVIYMGGNAVEVELKDSDTGEYVEASFTIIAIGESSY